MVDTAEESEEVATPSPAKLDLWTPYRDFYHKIDQYLYQGFTEGTKPEDFYNLLMQHKQNFICLLQNPPKNTKSRDELKKGMEDGISIKEIGHQILSRDLYQEAIILSDMYDLNEFVALDLLCTAQIQMPYHPGLPRGLVAVLLYYEGRKFIVSSLKLLVHARKGVSWSMNIDPAFEKYATTFTDQLADSGMFTRIFELLQTLDLTQEIEKLQENVALGGPRHQRQVVDLFTDIRQHLSEIVFLWAAQSGLQREPTLALLSFLRQLKPEEDLHGVIDNVTVFALVAALYAFDLSVLHFREDGEDIIQDLPIFTDKEYVSSVNAELSGRKSWVDKGLEGVVTLGFALASSGLRVIPQYQETLAFIVPQKDSVFNFLCAKVLPNKIVYSDEIVTRRFHYFFTDFIIHMLQNKTSPEPFMMCIGKFYANDPLNLHYCLDYWCPIETNLHELYSYNAPFRALALYKFIKHAGDSVPATSFVTFTNMLASLSNHPQASRHCFNLLKQNNHTFNKIISWDHFFTCFNQYYNNLKQEVVIDTVYRRFTKGITPHEIDGLVSVLNLIRVIAEQDDFSRLALCEHPVWAPLTVLLGLVGCSVPIHFKAALIFTLAGLSKSSEIAAQMWNYIEASQILQTIPTTSRYQPRGIQTELEEVESRIEEYPLTQSFLKMLDVLTDSGIPRTLGAGPRQPGFDPYLTYLVNSVFLKFTTRSYKNPEERWIIGCACLRLFEKFLATYEPSALDFTEFNAPPGFHVMLLLTSKSEFLNLVLYIIDEGEKLLAQYVVLPGQRTIETCILHCLNILERALTLQSSFLNLSSSSPNPLLLTSLVKLLLMNSPRTGQPDHLISVTKYITYYASLSKHVAKILAILIHVTSSPIIHGQYLNVLTTFDESKKIRNGFVEALDNGNANAKRSILVLLKQCLAYATPNLSQFLLGFDLNKDVSLMVFQPAGVLNFPRTCLHSIFTIFKVTDSVDGSAYEILYLLYSNSRTVDPILRFTRLNGNFFEAHIVRGLGDPRKCAVQLAWLFKTLAIDLKIACNKVQILYLQRLVETLEDPLVSLLDVTESSELIDGLRQVVQVLALYLPYEAASPSAQYTIVVRLLKKILSVAVKAPLKNDDANHLSSTVLVLVQNIRRCLKLTTPDEMPNDVFGYLVRWLITSDAACQTLRIHLYVAIITFLHIAYPDVTTSKEAFYITRLDTSKVQAASHPLAANIPAIIAKVGERLVDLICQDCVGGHDVAKMLALLTFSKLIDANGDNAWIVFMVARGYLKYIIDGILQSDANLKQLLEPNYENLRIMYLFKAKLSLLLQIASTKIGAENLLELKTFACLSNMSVLSLHPEVVRQSQLLPERLQDFIPSVSARYLEIFIPTLELCNATITTLSIDNYQALTQILDFVVSQLGAFEHVLRNGTPALSEDFLHELATVTSTVALVSRANVAFVTKIQETFQNYNVPMLRIQKHMLTLLPRFLLDENVIHELLTDGDAFQTSQRLIHAIEIIANLFSYLRNIVTNSKAMLFKPTLGTCETPTIGTIVQHLIDFVAYHHNAKNTLAFLKIKLQDVPDMSHTDLRDFVKVSGVDTEIVRNDVAEFVAHKITKKTSELDYASYIIDNALYLLWVHLDHYMLQAIPRIRRGEIADGMSYFRTDAEAMWNVTVNDINDLKMGLVSVFNNGFNRQLLETTQGSSEVKKQFIEMLLRKIKRLLQFVPVSQAV